MAGTSYASAAAASSTPTPTTSATRPRPLTTTAGITTGNTPINPLVQLAAPPAKSMPLAATLHLLSSPLLAFNHHGNYHNNHNGLMTMPTATSKRREFVYLMTKSYLQNWLAWAAHQTVPTEETERLEQAIRMALDAYGFSLLSSKEVMEYENPGPLNATDLSESREHPRRLRPNVVVQHPSQLVHVDDKIKTIPAPSGASSTSPSSSMTCCAVPESFYELLRKVHGVLCDDGESVSFQPFDGDDPFLSYQYVGPAKVEPKPSSMMSNGHHHHPTSQPGDASRPIEFRRKIVYQRPLAILPPSQAGKSPVSKLIQQDNLALAMPVPTVEVYPRKISFTTTSMAATPVKETIASSKPTNGSINGSSELSGYVLASQDAPVVDVLHAVMKLAAPSRSSECVRVWIKRGPIALRGDKSSLGATAVGDDYELIHLDSMDGSLLRVLKANGQVPPAKPLKSSMTVQQWMARQGPPHANIMSVEVLVETKSNIEAPWPRKALELEHRIQVGDFVDAQDAEGKWYESVVREVSTDTVKVHYIGWASRWDTTIRRFTAGPVPLGVRSNIRPPAPLWTHTARWRESLHVGQFVEIRESTSPAERPKWFKGIIKAVSKLGDPLYEILGGADLETYCVNGVGKMLPLLLLHRTRQVLVEVPQELNLKSRPASVKNSNNSSGLVAQPPFLRWVNAYGEEICATGTHLEIHNLSDRPATLAYEVGGDRAPVEVLKPYGSMLGAGFIRESLRGVPPAPGSVGLQNLGNSCFLNSVIQCLNHIEPLTKYFLSDNYVAELNRYNPLGSGGNVAVAYASLVRDMWSGEYSILAPRLLKQTVANFAPQFNNSYQHDSHEFCSFLMDGLHEDLNRVKTKPYVEELEGLGMDDGKIAIESWRRHLLRHDSIIVDYCQGMHRSHLTCPGCGKESLKFDVFSSISLPLAPPKDRSAVPLTECIEQFMEGEQLDEANAWYCPACKKHVCALKMIALWSVPDILIFQLKRFTFSTSSKDSGKVLRSKIDCLVQFPLDKLDLSKYILGPIDADNPPVYKLFGVSEHSGSTANSGHYTATVRNSQDGQWYRYNDSHVGETSGDAAVTGGAYLLFYQRSKGSLKWGGLEKVMQARGVNPYGGLETDQDGFTQVKTKKSKKKGKA